MLTIDMKLESPSCDSVGTASRSAPAARIFTLDLAGFGGLHLVLEFLVGGARVLTSITRSATLVPLSSYSSRTVSTIISSGPICSVLATESCAIELSWG